MTWAVWVTGLPGSGKTTITKHAIEKLKADGIKVQHLRLDDFRKYIVPKPQYTSEERELVYRSLAIMAKTLVDNGVNVIIDATGNLKKYRDFVREKIPRLKEVYVKCPVEICMEREANRGDSKTTVDLYRKALEYLKTGAHADEIGKVPGVNAPYEAPENPELTIDSENTDPEKAGEMIYGLVKALH